MRNFVEPDVLGLSSPISRHESPPSGDPNVANIDAVHYRIVNHGTPTIQFSTPRCKRKLAKPDKVLAHVGYTRGVRFAGYSPSCVIK